MVAIDRVAEGIPGDEHLLAFPAVVVGAAQEDPDPEVDLDQIVGD